MSAAALSYANDDESSSTITDNSSNCDGCIAEAVSPLSFDAIRLLLSKRTIAHVANISTGMLGENKTASHFFFVAKYIRPLANDSAYVITDAGADDGQERISIAHTGIAHGGISGMSHTMDTIQESTVSSGCISSISTAAHAAVRSIGHSDASAISAGSLAGA